MSFIFSHFGAFWTSTKSFKRKILPIKPLVCELWLCSTICCMLSLETINIVQIETFVHFWNLRNVTGWKFFSEIDKRKKKVYWKFKLPFAKSFHLIINCKNRNFSIINAELFASEWVQPWKLIESRQLSNIVRKNLMLCFYIKSEDEVLIILVKFNRRNLSVKVLWNYLKFKMS